MIAQCSSEEGPWTALLASPGDVVEVQASPAHRRLPQAESVLGGLQTAGPQSCTWKPCSWAESLAFLAVRRSAGSTVVVLLQLGHRNGEETQGTSVRVPWEGQKRPVTNELRVLVAEIPWCAQPRAGTCTHELPQPLPLLHGLPHPETQPQGGKAPSLGLLTASCLVFRRNYWSFS